MYVEPADGQVIHVVLTTFLLIEIRHFYLPKREKMKQKKFSKNH